MPSLTGTSSLTFTPSATLTGVSSTTGSSTLNFSPSAVLTGSVLTTGTSSLTFTPAAVLRGSGDLSNAPFTETLFTVSGLLAGQAYLTSNSSITISIYSNLGGTAQVSGALQITFFTSIVPSYYIDFIEVSDIWLMVNGVLGHFEHPDSDSGTVHIDKPDTLVHIEKPDATDPYITNPDCANDTCFVRIP